HRRPADRHPHDRRDDPARRLRRPHRPVHGKDRRAGRRPRKAPHPLGIVMIIHWINTEFWGPIWPNLAASALCSAIVYVRLRAHQDRLLLEQRRGGRPPLTGGAGTSLRSSTTSSTRWPRPGEKP